MPANDATASLDGDKMGTRRSVLDATGETRCYELQISALKP
jgi:hypothetical protein